MGTRKPIDCDDCGVDTSTVGYKLWHGNRGKKLCLDCYNKDVKKTGGRVDAPVNKKTK
jgi:hypothetical protein